MLCATLLLVCLPDRSAVPADAPLLSIMTQGLEYPKTAKVDVVETLHGIKVSDPYRWLEDLDSSETKAWVDAQNKVTFAYLAGIPERDRIKKRLTKAWDFERFGLPFKEGGRYFFTKNDGLQNQSGLYVADTLDAKPRVLLDPNKLSKDGTVALTGTVVSRDGSYMAYGVAEAGSDWQEWRVRNVKTGKDVSDRIKWGKVSAASWTKDGKGFFYSRYDEPKPGEAMEQANYYQKLYYHRLGTAQSEDALIYERPDQKDWGFGGKVTEDGNLLVITVWKGTERENRVFYKRLDTKNAEVVELIPEPDAQYSFIGNDGDLLYFQTDKDAPLGKVIAVNLRHPEPKNRTLVIPEKKEALQAVSLVGGRFIARYLKDARSLVRVFETDGMFERHIRLPGIGSAGGFGGKKDDSETFYTFTSFNAPTAVYRYDVATGKSSVFRKLEVDIETSAFVTKQIFYRSKDGTRVPMFVTHKKGLKLDGSNPTVLTGYGGFNAAITPYFSITYSVWMEMGGVLAVANLRGGGEYGTEWHDAGRLNNKQNVFDDFIAAAEWLIDNKYTNRSKLAIEGGSNGGLLVGAVLNQRPELFGAALPSVGVMDMLRFHKFTIGWAWVSDYGSPDDPDDFKVLFAYSPYHNLKPGTNYPAVMVTTGDHDDRVVPAHSFKYAARLQECQAGDAPVVIRIETSAGHGAGKPTSKIIQEVADKLAFLVKNLGVELPKGFGR